MQEFMWKIKILDKSKGKKSFKDNPKKNMENASNCTNFSPKRSNYIKETFSTLITLAIGVQDQLNKQETFHLNSSAMPIFTLLA